MNPSLKAFIRYEQVRNRLPVDNFKKPHLSQKIEGILEIADDFDTFFFDAYGVLNIGDEAIPSSVPVIKELQKIGKNCLVLSNAAGFTHNSYQAKYLNYGFDFSLENIIISRDALIAELRDNADKSKTYGFITKNERQDDLFNLGLKTIHQDEKGFWDSDVFLFLGSMDWDWDLQKRWLEELNKNPRPILLGNADLISPKGGEEVLEAASFVLNLEDKIFKNTKVFGKPYPAIYEAGVRELKRQGKSFNPERTLMVGDTLHTDILGGNSFGIKTALVIGYGFFNGLDWQEFAQLADIYPDFVMKGI